MYQNFPTIKMYLLTIHFEIISSHQIIQFLSYFQKKILNHIKTFIDIYNVLSIKNDKTFLCFCNCAST